MSIQGTQHSSGRPWHDGQSAGPLSRQSAITGMLTSACRLWWCRWRRQPPSKAMATRMLFTGPAAMLPSDSACRSTAPFRAVPAGAMQAEFQRMLADRLEEHAPHYRLTNLQYRQAVAGDCRQLGPLAAPASTSVCAPEAAVQNQLADCLACALHRLQLLVLHAF